MVTVLIVGATRGLGASLTKQYASQSSNTVFATARSSSAPTDFPKSVQWLHDIDLMKNSVGDKIAGQLGDQKLLDVVVSLDPKKGILSSYPELTLVPQVHYRRPFHDRRLL